MKIFIACNIIRGNPLIRQLVDAYQTDKRIKELDYGVDRFWQRSHSVDILHFHWPEILFGWEEPDKNAIKKLQTHLANWKNTLVVATIHDYYPHYRETDNFRLLFDTLYKHCDGFIHMGKASLQDFINRNPDTKLRLHRIIPLPVNNYFPNIVSRSESLNKLMIPAERFVYLSFGALRHQEESNLLINGFRDLDLPNKYLIIAGPWLDIADDQKIILKENNISVIEKYIPDDMVQYYLNAANVLIIPRVRNLNSGNVALGFGFGKVVVGPAIGTIGENLHETGNPVFDPFDPNSLIESLKVAELLFKEGKGISNQFYANFKWGLEYVKDCHIDFYQELISKNAGVNKCTDLP